MQRKLLIIALVISSFDSRISHADEKVTKEFLIIQLQLAVSAGARLRLVKADHTGSENAKSYTCQSENRLDKESGSSLITGEISMARGYNSQYAFLLTAEPSGSKPIEWSIKKYSDINDPKGYQLIRGMVSQSGSLFERANRSDSTALLEHLQENSIEIVEQKQLESEAIELRFANTSEHKERIKEYDREMRNFQVVAQSLSENTTELKPPIDRRPTEVVEMICVVEPNFGWSVSKLILITASADGIVSKYVGQAKDFKKSNLFWYPEKYEFTRESGKSTENTQSTIKEISFDPVPNDAASLAFYGLPDPIAQSTAQDTEGVTSNYLSNYWKLEFGVALAGIAGVTVWLYLRGRKIKHG